MLRRMSLGEAGSHMLHSEDWMERPWNSLPWSRVPRGLALDGIWLHPDCLRGLRDFTDEQHEEIAEVSHAFSNVATVSVEELDRFAAQTNETVFAHRPILAAWSTYFKTFLPSLGFMIWFRPLFIPTIPPDTL